MKKKILVIFGGQSSEHAVSVRSAISVLESMDKTRYEALMVGITREGEWNWVEDIQSLRDGTWRDSPVKAYLQPCAGKKHLLLAGEEGYTEKQVDAAFPVLHGLYGEDGTIQGLFELARLPYVGCGVLASACGMDKLYTKIIVERLGIRQAAYLALYAREIREELERCIQRVEERFTYPVFVKPSNAGSSKGVSKADTRQALECALQEAVLHDRKVLVEEFIRGREIECAVLGDRRQVCASGLGEIQAAADFYDFDAKYNNPDSLTIVGPVLEEGLRENIRESALRIFEAIDGYGLSRVDFFVTEAGEVIFNEINTLPGFTSISMYPMLWEAEGMRKQDLVTALIEQAFRRDETNVGGESADRCI